MAPKKHQVSGPRPKRPVRATAKRSASCDSFIAVKSPQNGETKTTSQSPPQALRSPPIETGTTPSFSVEVATCAPISANTVEECGVEEEKRQSSSDGRIGVGKETLAEEDGNPEIARRIGTGIEEKDSVVVEEMKPKEKEKEKKKKKVKVVKVVKKLVKKRVLKSVHKGVAACSNKELATERNFDDNVEKINSGEVVGMVDLSEGFEKQPKVLDSDVSMLAEHEYGKVDSLTSVPIEVENSGVGGSLSGDEAENPDQPVGVCMEVDELKAIGEGGNEVPLCEVSLDGEKNSHVVENFDSATALLMDVVNEDLSGEKSNEIVVLRSGNEEEGNGGVGEADESVAGNGRIVLSGELEALERQRRRKTEIFIGGLNTDAKEEDVRQVFEEVGEIVEVRLMINGKTGRNKGYAFVRYASADDAKKALEKYPKVEICGKQCATAPVEGNDTIFLGNIDKKWTNENVIKLLQEMGIEKIDKVTVMTDPSNVGRNRGFAFLELETSKDAQIAFKKLQKKDLGKLQNIKVAWAEPISEPDEAELLKVKSVYAEYLPFSWDEEKVKSCFMKFGEIENVVLSQNLHSSKRKDFAFINFKTREAALACIESFKHEMLCDEGSQVNVKVSLAKPIPKGRPHKKVSKSTSKESSKHKTTQHPVKLIEPRVKQTAALQINNQRTGDVRSLETTELEKLLAERALRKQMLARLDTGMANMDYSRALPGQKRSFSAFGDDLNYSDPRGYPRVRLESAFPAGSPSYGEVSPGVGVALSSRYQQRGSYYSLDHRYLDYANSFQREDALHRDDYRGINRDYFRY